MPVRDAEMFLPPLHVAWNNSRKKSPLEGDSLFHFALRQGIDISLDPEDRERVPSLKRKRAEMEDTHAMIGCESEKEDRNSDEDVPNDDGVDTVGMEDGELRRSEVEQEEVEDDDCNVDGGRGRRLSSEVSGQESICATGVSTALDILSSSKSEEVPILLSSDTAKKSEVTRRSGPITGKQKRKKQKKGKSQGGRKNVSVPRVGEDGDTKEEEEEEEVDPFARLNGLIEKEGEEKAASKKKGKTEKQRLKSKIWREKQKKHLEMVEQMKLQQALRRPVCEFYLKGICR
jgi:hypothetical protein